VQLRIDTVYRSKTDTITKVVEIPAKKSGIKVSPWLIVSAIISLIAVFLIKIAK